MLRSRGGGVRYYHEYLEGAFHIEIWKNEVVLSKSQNLEIWIMVYRISIEILRFEQDHLIYPNLDILRFEQQPFIYPNLEI